MSKLKTKAMTIREWWDEVGTENVQQIAEAIPTTMAYMRHLRYRANGKRPGYDFALRLIQLATEMTPGFVPDLTAMMAAPDGNRATGLRTKTIQPSPDFLRSQAERVASK